MIGASRLIFRVKNRDAAKPTLVSDAASLFIMPVSGYYAFMNNSISSSTVPIPAIPNVSTRTLATFGDKNPGKVGPK